jgi:hypothetical protein
MGNIVTIHCPNCGNYQLAEAFHSDYLASNRFQPIQLATLSYAIRRMQSHRTFPLIVEDFASNIIQNTILPTATEQIDNLVLFLGKTLSEPGEKLQLRSGMMRATLGTITNAASVWVLQQAIDHGLMQGTLPSAIGAGDMPVMNATLSIAGWQRFTELQTATSGSRRAFMAMKFGDDELDAVFNNCFRKAAKRAGYDLMKLDDEPRAGLIDDRLRLDIRTSRFMIADLSHANKGAYWEAGFAEGLGRPVIYTCKKSVFEDVNPDMRPHFDTNHRLIVLWDPSNLQSAFEQLTTTIRVTLPSEARLDDE